MGAGVSDYRLARAVSQSGGLGVVSGTGINTILLRRLQDGDPEGNVRRAIQAFPDPEVAARILQAYFVDGGREPGEPYGLAPMPAVEASLRFHQMNVLAAFVEVYLAKEGHSGPVGINFLEKIQTSNLSGIYGAMLAGVDVVLVGAGIPREIPGVLDSLSEHADVSILAHVVPAFEGQGGPVPEVRIHFSPKTTLPGYHRALRPPLQRPQFLAIVSSITLAQHLAKKASGRVDGFIVEHHVAGGHNAPPRGPLKLSSAGEPIYGPKDETSVESFRDLGLPFWLAGAYASPERFAEARALGAHGVQIGTAFAFCEESGLAPRFKTAVLKKWGQGDAAELVFTDPYASPTGFPFKVIPLSDTLADRKLYGVRNRVCDLGYLRQTIVMPDGSVMFRCPAEPTEDYVRKGGKAEESIGRKCLCNALMANIGLAQFQIGAVHPELPLLTAGDDLGVIARFARGPDGFREYTAADVISVLQGATESVPETRHESPDSASRHAPLP